MGVARRLGVGLLVFAALGSAASAALAAPPPKQPPSGNAAISVYVEQIPTGSGSIAAGGSGKKSKLPTSTLKKLHEQAGGDAAALEELATSSGYGAPQAEQMQQRPSAGAVGQAHDTLTAKRKSLHPSQSAAQRAAAAERSRLAQTRVVRQGAGPGTRPIMLLVLLALATLAMVIGRVRAQPQDVDRRRPRARPAP